jgi:hypothetical protein
MCVCVYVCIYERDMKSAAAVKHLRERFEVCLGLCACACMSMYV